MGKDDEDLLPHFLELVKQCRPDRIFGEQVERSLGTDGLMIYKQQWKQKVTPSGVCIGRTASARRIRQRLYWVADAEIASRGGRAVGDRESYGGRTLDGLQRHTDIGQRDQWEAMNRQYSTARPGRTRQPI